MCNETSLISSGGIVVFHNSIICQPCEYCKSGNFHATLIFFFFCFSRTSDGLAQNEKQAKVFILCVGLCRMAEKSEFKNKQKCQKLLKAEKLHMRKLPLL